MLVYIRIEDGLKRRAEELAARGLYPDFNTVVTVALQNLLVAEEEAAQSPNPSAHVIQTQVASPTNADSATPPSPITASPKSVQWKGTAPSIEGLIVPSPADLFLPEQKVPVEKWVFGQQNRVLPAKINVRLFLGLVAARGSEVELFEAASQISSGAAQVYEFLNGLDKRFGHGKDDLLSTGFPEPGSEKATSRYANHFAAYESTQGNLTGMLIQWKFVGVKRVKNKTYLFPTQACVDFAALANPLLDEPVTGKPTEKFSHDEVAWATEHVRHHVPVEFSAFTTILNGLREGFTSPDAIDEYVRQRAMGKADVSAAFVSTQRSGAFSRMADLNLVRRQREGTKVAYEITELGNKWLMDQP